MAKQSALPKSRATTAYGLLTEIRRLILEEPKRYNQQRFIQRVDAPLLGEMADPLSPREAAPCGTRACVAGWVVTLKHRKPVTYFNVGRIARQILGLDVDAADALFGGGAAGATNPGTVLHARRGAAHIARFQKRYESQLKRTRV